MGRLVVPSDISLLENKYTLSRRELSLAERLSLLALPPVLKLGFNQHDKHSFKRILSRSYGIPEENGTDSDQLIVDILERRQSSVRRRVFSNIFAQMGTVIGAILTASSIKFYDLKTKCIVLPFATYGSFFVGRWTGDLFTKRWSEFYRDRFLGELPAQQFYIIKKDKENAHPANGITQ